LPVVLYGYETWSLTLTKMHRLKFKVEIFWMMTSCSVVVGYKRFGGPC